MSFLLTVFPKESGARLSALMQSAKSRSRSPLGFRSHRRAAISCSSFLTTWEITEPRSRLQSAAFASSFCPGISRSLNPPRPVEKEVLPTHRFNSKPLHGGSLWLIAQNKRSILAIAGHEFSKAAKVGRHDRAVFTSIAHLPQDPPRTASTSSGSSRQ